MCGIMGYIGPQSAKNVIFNGLVRLEYRGYDSAGIAVMDNTINIVKSGGSTSNLDLDSIPHTQIGIGHTRWATHGKPTKTNAHPHTFGVITLVHNGIIENYQELSKLIDSSKLKSETDSEVLAGLIDYYYKKYPDLLQATKQALSETKGTFGIAVISPANPEQIIVARRGSPIVIGVGDKQHYVASDPSAIIDHTDKVVYLQDNQIAIVQAETVAIYDLKLKTQAVAVETLEVSRESLNKGSYTSFLEKEISEQPMALENLMLGRISSDGDIRLGGPNLTNADIKTLKHILIIGCGTSYYAGCYAKYELEKLLGILVSVEHASEYRYRFSAFDPETTLAIFLSQSGETADTLASLREANRRGLKTMGIINTVGSTIAREVNSGGIYLHAGIESSVASTKAYSSMVAALLMFAGHLAYHQGKDFEITRDIAMQLLKLPKFIASTITGQLLIIKKMIPELCKYNNWFFLGRGNLYPVALEGALKVTEVSYVSAQAFPSGEMKHGPIALIDDQHLSILLLPDDELLYKKSLSTLEEIKARNGRVLTISTRKKEKNSDFHIKLEHLGGQTDGLIYNVCSQLIALLMATKKGLNIDRPRNLAKSVTVE